MRALCRVALEVPLVRLVPLVRKLGRVVLGRTPLVVALVLVPLVRELGRMV